jgi:ubiquinone/menaquinone biosynthesis C-methylase UbiE
MAPNTGSPVTPHAAEERLRTEFNRWAEQGRGEEMERHHIPITAPVLAQMQLAPEDVVLDLGCGAGWATRLLAERIPQGKAVGVDVSDEMVRHAREASASFGNIEFRVGSAEQIPAKENEFHKLLSVESFYYYNDQDRALEEIRRVLAPGGRFFILINLYKDNAYSLRWVKELAVPVHALSEAEYLELIRKHGFTHAAASRVPDDSPTPETYSGKWFRNAEELRDFKRLGALLLTAQKPGA